MGSSNDRPERWEEYQQQKASVTFLGCECVLFTLEHQTDNGTKMMSQPFAVFGLRQNVERRTTNPARFVEGVTYHHEHTAALDALAYNNY